jgi:hypothetical protein
MANVLGYVSTDLETPYEGELDLENLDEWYQDKIDEAVRLLLRKAPTIVSRMAAYDPVTGTGIDPNFVKDKVIGAVLRVLRDPEGMQSETEGNYSYKRNPVVASGNIWFTKDELADLGIIATAAVRPRTVFASNRYGWP